MLVKNSIREKTIYININVPLVEWNPAEKMSLMTRLTVEAAAVDVEALPMPYVCRRCRSRKSLFV